MLLALGAAALLRGADAPALDAAFQPRFTTTRGAALYAVALQGERVLVAGDFALVAGMPSPGLARFESDGRLDATFNPGRGTDGCVYALAVEPETGRILVGGRFGAIQGVPRAGLARLEPDGALDLAFAPRLAGASHVVVSALLLEPDGGLLLAGWFESVDGHPRHGLARLRADGSVDEAFDPGPGLQGGMAYDLARQEDGSVLVAGAFTHVNDAPAAGLARLRPDGSVDLDFQSRLVSTLGAGRVYAVAVQPGRGLIVAGTFQAAGPPVGRHVLRLDFDGKPDAGFGLTEGVAGGQEAIFDVLALPEGLVIAGSFSQTAELERNCLARLTPDGRPDATFDPGPGLLSSEPASVNMLALQPDGKILVVGEFFEASGQPRHCLARFLPDGSLDESFGNETTFFELPGEVRALALADHGRILAGGYFERVNGQWRPNLARLEADGTLDEKFDAGLEPDTEIHAVVREARGRWVIGGRFESVRGVEHRHLARLFEDGSPDEAWTIPMFDGPVRALAALPTGELVVGGEFGVVNHQRRLRLVRLLEDGTVDETFDARFESDLGSAVVSALGVDEQGRVVVGGRFYRANGQARHHLARLYPDGRLDTDFAAGLNLGGPEAAVNALAPLPGGRWMAGGTFTRVNALARPGLVRLRPDGTPDPGFAPRFPATADPPTVSALAAWPDGRVAAAWRSGPDGAAAPGVLLLFDSRGTELGLPPDGWTTEGSLLALLPEGNRLLAAGGFSNLNGTNHVALARLSIPEVSVELTLYVTREDDDVVVDWFGPARLLEAESPLGPWREIPDAPAPYRLPAGRALGFYRLTR